MDNENEPKMKKGLLVSVAVLVILLLVGGGYYLGTQKKVDTQVTPTPYSTTDIITSTPLSTTPTPKVSSTPLSTTLLYTEVSGTVNTPGRAYDVVKIFRKVGSAKPELLATVGKAGEFPSSFVLSPDKKTLLINLESKLQALDLSSKALTTVFTPKKQVFDLVYSPDGTRIFIWDQIYAPSNNDYAYYVHDFNLSTKKDTILAQGTEQQIYYPVEWRKDDVVVLGIPKGEFSGIASFNVATKKLYTTPGNFSQGVVSQTGMRMATYEKSIDDACNSFSGSANSTHKIIDPVSGKEYANIGASDKRVSVIAFSPDDEMVAYSEQASRTSQNDCDQEQSSTYYQASAESTGTPTVVNDIDALLNSWGLGEYAYASTKDGKAWSIYEQGKVTVSSNSPLRVISAY